MRLEPVLQLKAEQGTVTARQLEVLRAVDEAGSINAAASLLSVRAPVIFRHVRAAEEAVGARLLGRAGRGSELTPAGRELLKEGESLSRRLEAKRGMMVACSPVSEELLMACIPKVDDSIGLVVSDDERNVRSLLEGRADLVILDDPLHLLDLEEHRAVEIGHMDMVHVDRGPRYVRYRFGAQRIAFRHLDLAGAEYEVEGELLSVNELLDSGRSFFIDEVLLLRRGVSMQSSTDPRLLRHAVMAVHDSDDPRVEALLRELRGKMGG